jgi:hypothetical protein
MVHLLLLLLLTRLDLITCLLLINVSVIRSFLVIMIITILSVIIIAITTQVITITVTTQMSFHFLFLPLLFSVWFLLHDLSIPIARHHDDGCFQSIAESIQLIERYWLGLIPANRFAQSYCCFSQLLGSIRSSQLLEQCHIASMIRFEQHE